MPGSFRLLSSPRRRRRVVRAAIALAVVGGAAFGIVELVGTNRPTPIKNVFEPGKPVVVGNQKTVPLTKAEKREIGVTLERFVRSGVAKQHPEEAFDLVTSNFRGGTTRSQWRKGDTPVYAYPDPVVGDIAHQWRPDFSYRNDVGISLMLASRHPRKVGAIIFHGEVLRRHGRWLVDSFAPVATFTPIGVGRQHETGPADYAAGAGADTRSDKAPLSAMWIAIPAGVLALGLLVPLAFFVAGRVRERRVARAYEAAAPKTLPPLPPRN
jgi:hypothetical protein